MNTEQLSKQVQDLMNIHIGQPVYLIINYNGKPLNTVDNIITKIEISPRNIFIHAKHGSTYDRSFRLGVTAFLTKEERDIAYSEALRLTSTF